MFKVNFVFKVNFKHNFRVRSGSWCRLGLLKESSQIYFQSTVQYLCKVCGKGSRAPVKEEGKTVHILGPLQPLTLRHTPCKQVSRKVKGQVQGNYVQETLGQKNSKQTQGGELGIYQKHKLR